MGVLEAARPVGFVPILDGETAREFYAGTLGLSVLSDDQFAVVMDNGGVPLRLVKVREFTPQPFTVLGWEVADLVAAVDALVAAGVQAMRYPGMGQDERGIWQPPGSSAGVWWFQDPFGNLLSLTGSP